MFVVSKYVLLKEAEALNMSNRDHRLSSEMYKNVPDTKHTSEHSITVRLVVSTNGSNGARVAFNLHFG